MENEIPGLLGWILIGTGVVHTAVGLWLGGASAREIWAHGLGAVSMAHPQRFALLWFLWAGFSWVILGALVVWLELAAGVAAPVWLAIALLVYAIGGALLQPRSGFPVLAAILAGWIAAA